MACKDCGETGLPLKIPSGTNGTNGAPGENGQFGGWSQRMVFDTATSASPLATKLRLNNATPASVTQIYANDLNADSTDIDAFLDAFDNSSAYGYVKLWKQFDSNTFWMGEVTGVTDNGADHTIDVTYVSHNNTFSNEDSIVISFVGKGASGVSYFSGTYSQLTALVGTLIPGGTYILTDYETSHEVVGTGLLNIATPGYITKTESLKLTAKDASSFYHEVESVDHPEDDILYDFTLNTILGNPRPGLIYWRKDNGSNVEAWFDVRNHIVGRYDLNFASISYVSDPVQREEIVDNGGKILQSVRDGASVANYRLVDDISNLAQPLHTNLGITYFGTTLPASAGTLSYHEAISPLTTNTILDKGCSDILVDVCSNVWIKSDAVGISIVNSSDIVIGSGTTKVVIDSTDEVEIGNNADNIFLWSSASVTIGSGSGSILVWQSDVVKIGKDTRKVLNQSSHNTTIGDDGTSLMIIRSSANTVIGTDCSGISLGYSSHNLFDQYCSDIQIYSGGHNRFAQGCNVIGLIGELDDAHTGVANQDPSNTWAPAGEYYSPYSQMEHNTFGTGCSNINFYILGGRGNQFGDECKNLAFTKGDYSEPWRLVGTHWVRGIQNKTFQDVMHGASFLVPNQATVIVDNTRWYAQLFSFNVHNASGAWVVAIPDAQVADATLYTFNLKDMRDETNIIIQTVSFTSGVGATKASILAGLLASVNTGTIATAVVVDNRLYVEAANTMGANSPLAPIVCEEIAGNPVRLIMEKAGPETARDNRIFQEMVTAPIVWSSVEVGADGAVFSGTTGYGTTNGELDANGVLPVTANMQVYGNKPTNRAWMWTSEGYPLSMAMQRHVTAGGNPTASLER